MTAAATRPCCLACGHAFDTAELAAMTAREDRCVVACSECGARNEVRAEPRPGFEAQPALIVLRISDEPAGREPVFEETPARGVRPPPG